MPRYDDDLDRRDEFDDADEAFEPDRSSNRRIVRAKNSVRGPAIGLLICAILGLLFSGYLLFAVNMPQFDARYNQSVKAQANDPNKSEKEKKEFQQMMEDVREPMKKSILVVSTISVIANLLILLSSILMLSLKAHGLSYFASILAMIPFTNCFCVLGLPFGIWALLTLGKPEVKAGYAAAASQ